MLRRREVGVGLIELMIAVVILGIMTAMVAPGMTTWIRNSRVRTVADALQSGVRLAQAEAQRRTHAVVFFRTASKACLSSDRANARGQYWQVRALPGTLLTAQASQVVQCGVLTDVSAGVNITSRRQATTAAVTAICFGGDGRQITLNNPDGIGVNCTAIASQFDVAPSTTHAENRPLRVMVSLAGAVRLCDPSKTSAAPDGCPP